ncbi:MAG: RNA polymerase sigma factor [Kiritimatiellae bacterium]|nr:RNA polymerase sigma factor [Kiritimatiellia bacterium]
MESDAEIVQRVVGGDVEAFEHLLRRHAARVFENVGRRVPAAEVPAVAQDVFLGAFRSLASYGRRQPFDHWLLRIARRRCYDYWRLRKRVDRHRAEPRDENARDWLERVTAGPVCEQGREEAGREEAARAVRQALEALDPEDRAMMEAVYFEEVPLKDVAAGFGWSLAKTKMRALRARRALRGILERWRMGGEAPV